jgi:chemoreceptor zinc-binding protein
MNTHQQIVKAIGAHGMWKARLQKAIDQGVSDVSVAVARQDNQCDFGKWLYATDLPAETKGSQHYTQCRDLHRQFHVAAAKVLTLALAAKKDEAAHAIGMGSEFANCSASLTKAMMNWDKEAAR